MRAERLATSERVYTARVRECELATANWEKRHPGISATDPGVSVAALEREHQAAIADVARLEHDKQAAVVEAHTTSWERDYAAVDQARVSAVDAPVFRRRSAQEAHENARRDFTAKHGHEPTPQPPEQLRDTWRRAATAPGRDERLEAARRHVDERRKKLEHLQRDPAPTRPTAPTPGTPAQERAKDAQYLQDRKQLEQRRTTSPEIRRPRTPTRSIER
ncbi:hypothetical protein [Microbacterium maritypicum]|uniref:Uncharacterized protein n=1 Tax=Microbacterium maritypicum TaxID=33918 RepID=A0A4Y4B7W9_MICMQ|nr:hypothetical protein [Microbacterium liquefaciens]GEC76628.1 hypothetical protein MLI01_27730 [Microbacterium liquefaciens]GGV63384.1 hypothetical protein GCM10010213_28230 [Microbacterium liquefaciens]